MSALASKLTKVKPRIVLNRKGKVLYYFSGKQQRQYNFYSLHDAIIRAAMEGARGSNSTNDDKETASSSL